MPYYAFTNKAGQSVERFYAMADCPRQVHHEGQTYKLDIVAMHRNTHATPGTYPFWSDAMAVHPTQIGKMRAIDKKLGLSANYNTTDGRVRFESAEHRKKYCEAHGFYDKNAGYGDPRRLKRSVRYPQLQGDD